MTTRQINDDAAAVRNEHATLNREIVEWRDWWSELSELGIPHFGEMGDRLAQFREHLAAHFAHEENQGRLSLVMTVPSQVVERIARLRDEHGGLLAELDRLIARLHALEPDFDCWGDAREDFEAFLDRLNAHEDAEEALLER